MAHNNTESENHTRFYQITTLLLLLLTAIWFFPMLYIFVVPIALAAVTATITFPFYKWVLARLKYKKIPASIICCTALIIGILIPLYILIHLVINQVVTIAPSVIPWLSSFIETWRERPIVRWFLQTPAGSYIFDNVDLVAIGQNLLSNLGSLFTIIANRTYAGVFGFAFDILITFFMLFYFYIDSEKIVSSIKYIAPLRPSYKDMIISRFVQISRATVLGTLIIAFVDGLLGGLTLLIFGVSGWLFWGFIIAILSILPVVGVSTILIPAGIIQLLLGNIWQGIGILLTHFVFVGNADNLIRPRVVGSQAHMHDLIILISTIGGLSLFGITGFIIGPIIAALFLAALDIYKEEFKDQLAPKENH